MKVKSESEVAQSFATPWTAAYQAPPSMGLSRQEYWSGVPLPSPDKLEVANKRMLPSLEYQIIIYIYFFFNFILFLNFTILY